MLTIPYWRDSVNTMARGVKRTFIETKPCARCGASFERKRKYSAAQWATAAFCSRRCGAWNLGVTKNDDVRMARISESMRTAMTGRLPWSKGLTKETHPSLAVVSRKVSIAQRGKSINDAQRRGLEIGRRWNKGRTKDACESIARRAAAQSSRLKGVPKPEHGERLRKLYAKRPDLHPNAIVARKTKGKGHTHIERMIANLLDSMNVPYRFNVRIGTKWPDFSIEHCHLTR